MQALFCAELCYGPGKPVPACLEIRITDLQNFACAVSPKVIPVNGLDAQRQWYLFEEVVPYCSNPLVCQRSVCPKLVIKVET